ncbi:hypothetical protein TNCV_5099441 [Trichonephila clavipes]|uniref:Uncharacterized protein n=1 Tax=Trichonephila clavipes TaxID=2585209 RepID=A0A8X6RZJ9_TRICX|nr:hypothetical protein TNCV_5099441 [Trichonephila clavipes]
MTKTRAGGGRKPVSEKVITDVSTLFIDGSWGSMVDTHITVNVEHSFWPGTTGSVASSEWAQYRNSFLAFF